MTNPNIPSESVFNSYGNYFQVRMYDNRNVRNPQTYHQVILKKQRYIIVEVGEKPCIQITNNTNNTFGVPVFVEKQNIYWGKAASPQSCQGGDMKTISPKETVSIPGFYNSQTKQLRPFVITGNSTSGIAESMFGQEIAKNIQGEYSVWVKDLITNPENELDTYFKTTTNRSSGASIGLGNPESYEQLQSKLVFSDQVTKLVDIRAITLDRLNELLGIRLGRGFNRFVDLDNRQDGWGQIPTSGNQPFRG